MKSLIFLFLSGLVCHSCFSQYDSRPSRSRFYNSRFSTFTIGAGDILVYTISKGDSAYNYIVTVTKFGNEISFDYKIPQMEASGSILIQAGAVSEAVKYDTINSAKNNLTDESFLWLSKKNFKELASANVTAMDTGDGKENF